MKPENKLLKALTLYATLTWTLPPGTYDAVQIYRADTLTAPWAKIATLPGNATTYTDTAGGPGNCYRATVTSSATESQPSNNACLFKILGTIQLQLTQ